MPAHLVSATAGNPGAKLANLCVPKIVYIIIRFSFLDACNLRIGVQSWKFQAAI